MEKDNVHVQAVLGSCWTGLEISFGKVIVIIFLFIIFFFYIIFFLYPEAWRSQAFLNTYSLLVAIGSPKNYPRKHCRLLEVPNYLGI